MNRFHLWPAGLLSLAAFVAPALAQPAAGLPAVPGGPTVSPPVPTAPSADMQEDVEILGRLLDNAFAEAYGFHVHSPLAPLVTFTAPPGGAGYYPPAMTGSWPAFPDHPAPHTEGVYLKDYGVVYSVTLPPPATGPLPAPNAGGSNPPDDDWDRTRKGLHGEPPVPAPQPVPGHKPLSEVILKILADNGKHFGALADGERITVAVTFRGEANCANCHQNPGQPRTFGMPLVVTNQPAPGTTPQPGMPGPPGFDAGPATPSWLTEARNRVLLGDLHLKQGKTQDAIAAYKSAADLLNKATSGVGGPEGGLAAGDVPALLTAVDVCNKLAAAYVQAGDSDAAGKALKEAAEMAKRAEALTAAPGTANPSPPGPAAAAQQLPAKLVVTASKKLLDDVGSGKITFEAFSKAATVDYVQPTADKK